MTFKVTFNLACLTTHLMTAEMTHPRIREFRPQVCTSDRNASNKTILEASFTIFEGPVAFAKTVVSCTNRRNTDFEGWLGVSMQACCIFLCILFRKGFCDDIVQILMNCLQRDLQCDPQFSPPNQSSNPPSIPPFKHNTISTPSLHFRCQNELKNNSWGQFSYF